MYACFTTVKRQLYQKRIAFSTIMAGHVSHSSEASQFIIISAESCTCTIASLTNFLKFCGKD